MVDGISFLICGICKRGGISWGAYFAPAQHDFAYLNDGFSVGKEVSFGPKDCD
jgi:hypothetical protein